MATKEELRNRVWQQMDDANVGAFPFPLQGRIPNFKGSNNAARNLASLSCWSQAHTIKANPDAPQLQARALAIEAGKRLFMAVPRLRDPEPFREIISPPGLNPRKAVSIGGSQEYGQPRAIDRLPQIDLVITGSVAVHRDGRRLGKGGGYSDLEFALASLEGLITDETLIVTTVHPLQVTDRDIPFEAHDIPIDYIVTPDEVIETKTSLPRPTGILPELLTRDYLDEIPALAAYRND